jgi:hypothetical protein
MKIMTKVLMKYLFRGEWKVKYVTLKEVVGRMAGGYYAKRVRAVRGYDEIATAGGLAGGTLAAENLPYVCPSMGEKGVYTGLVLLSFRVKAGQEVLEQLRQHVNLWPQTLMSFTGSSGQSLKVIIPYELATGGLPVDPEQTALFRQYAYKRAAEYALASTGMMAEEVMHDGSEGFRLSHDPQVYLNENVQPVRMEQPIKPLSELTAPVISKQEEAALDTEVLPGYTRREMDATKFNFVCRDLAFGRELPIEDYVMRLAVACRKAGIDQELATKLTLDMGDNYLKETLVRTTFENAYRQHPQGRTNPIDKSLMHQQLMESFLRRRYMFRRNRVTGDLEVQEKYRFQLWWKPLTPEVRNVINNAAIREGIKVWPKDLDRLVNTDLIKTYDPVREWLDALPRWDGRDRLGELAGRVPTATAGWRDDFKVWMRSMVSQWQAEQNATYGAQMVLMLVGGQGTRKSTFMRMLLPRKLMPFYIDRIDFANKKEALRALSRFLLINIDEYDQISKTQTAFLKHLIQRTDVKERKLYSTTFEQQQRYAAFCATTNSLVPLKDETGSRRYMVVEVSGTIDTDTSGDRRIDYPQLYAQIVSEIASGEDYAFTGERERRIQERNSDYYETPNVVSLFQDHYRRPQAGDEVLWLSPTEILQRMKDELKINLVTQSNATFLGNYLSRSGFQKGKGERRRCYALSPS